MPIFRVVVSGDGCQADVGGRVQPCSFRVLCHVWATDPAVAANMAAQLVRAAPSFVRATRHRTGPMSPVYIEEVDVAPAGEIREAIAPFRFFPPDDDLHHVAYLER